MKNIKKKPFVLVLILFFYLVGCKKESSIHQSTTNQDELSYSNSTSAMYFVELIGVDSKNLFTFLMLPNSKNVSLPITITSGHYDIVITPENLYSNISTSFNIGGIRGASSKYPTIIHNTPILIGNSKTLSIASN
jgi:hypothetical protein